MATRRLIISDLHLGGGDDLLRSPLALERIEEELRWADELVVNGDWLELVFASLTDAVAATRPFCTLVNRHVERVHYIPGNHDHHLVARASDERRLAQVLGEPEPPPFVVSGAEQLWRRLCPDVAVQTAYPIIELDGLRITHGHYIAPHIESLGWRALDRLAWHLTGTQRREQLDVNDYEALISPLYELMYEMANLPHGKQAQENFERLLVGAATLARAPLRASHQLAALTHSLADFVRRNEVRLEDDGQPVEQLLAAMTAVCINLDVAPGPVVFAHTHEPLLSVSGPEDRYQFSNSGSWVYDRRLRDSPDYRQRHWPGTVLRATGSQLERCDLLADLDHVDLQTMIGLQAPVKRRPLVRRLRPAASPSLGEG